MEVLKSLWQVHAVKIRERQMLAQAVGEQVRRFPPTFEIGDRTPKHGLEWLEWLSLEPLSYIGFIWYGIMYNHVHTFIGIMQYIYIYNQYINVNDSGIYGIDRISISDRIYNMGQYI